mmetsp:Transcript_21909/g.45635  ORF Transcript_21909/g.45635 Transcript_21909/m.45635 type:complete len:279 (-) Transcript_21909:31-867(-)
MAEFHLQSYLERIKLDQCDLTSAPDLESLRKIMNAHMRNIAFENMDVVCGSQISLSASDIFTKLVTNNRGGYCFEQNTLLQSALEALGFKTRPLLCRVRWGKGPHQDTPYTHMCLEVDMGKSCGVHLADVGFAGTNSMDPIDMTCEGDQVKPEGTFRLLREGHYTYLQVQDRDSPTSYRSLYCFHASTPCNHQDLLQSNWFSCTFPSARFTSQFFCARIVGADRHHVLNGEYVVRGMGGDVKERRKIEDLEELKGLVTGVFGLSLPKDQTLLGKYLSK